LITIKYSSGLSDEEVERMKHEAQQYSSDDHKRREVVDARNQADQLIYQTEKTLKEHGDRLSADAKQRIEDAKKKLEEVMNGSDAKTIKSAMDSYVEAAQQLAKVMYEQSGPKQGPTGQAGPGGPSPGQEPPDSGQKRTSGDDNIIDADYEVK